MTKGRTRHAPPVRSSRHGLDILKPERVCILEKKISSSRMSTEPGSPSAQAPPSLRGMSPGCQFSDRPEASEVADDVRWYAEQRYRQSLESPSTLAGRHDDRSRLICAVACVGRASGIRDGDAYRQASGAESVRDRRQHGLLAALKIKSRPASRASGLLIHRTG